MDLSTRHLIRSTIVFLLVGFFALMSIVGMNFWLGERAQSYFQDAIAVRDTRIAAVELRNAMLTAEDSQRGFMITGNEIYLAPYQTAKTHAERNLTALHVAFQTDPDGQAILARLTEILTKKFAEFDQTISLKRDGRDVEAATIVRSNTGKALTDEANVFFSGIISKADARLTAGVFEQRTNTGWLRLVSAIGALVIVAVTYGASYVIARYTSKLRKSGDEINALNADLEQRVNTRTADLEQSRDRAEVLLAEVNHRVANSLTLVSSLVNLQSKALTDHSAKEALAETRDRILAIALVHKRLYVSGDARSVSLDEYLSGLLDHLATSMRSQGTEVTVNYALDVITLGTDASISLGVVITELVTNAFKYAYPNGTGEIRVRLRQLPDQQAELIVEDDGVGRVEGVPAKGTGLGTKIVTAISQSIGAWTTYRQRHPGTAAHVIFPVKISTT
ncbi:MAG: CHASE3 domain-containing protein [bacterium]